MELIKRGSSEGVWFDYTGDARFKIRRIPSGKQKETFFRYFGKKTEVRRKGGAVISDTDMEASTKHNVELAEFALLDCENAEVPAELVPALGGQSGEMVRLDGKLTPEIKAAVLAELPGLAVWIVGKAESLTAKAAEEEEGLGKT
jgi:hypothetical protein